jgi:MSHA biogenesis protein MshP
MKMSRVQQGFSLVSAIFLLVVLAALGAAMVSFSTAQNQSLSIDVLGSRAYQAANAGVEWAAFTLESAPAASFPAATVFVPGTATALGGKLAPFAVTVSYTATPFVDETVAGSGVQPLTSHYVVASAVFGVAGTPDYVERVVTAKILR